MQILLTSGIRKGPRTVDIPKPGEEEVPTILACTWVHVVSEGVNATSFLVIEASATLTPLTMEPQTS